MNTGNNPNKRWTALIGGFPIIAWSLTLLFLTVPASVAQVSVSAFVNETTIGTEEVLTYTVEIRGASFSDIKTPDHPPTEGLALQSRAPSTKRNVSIVNGRMQQSLSFQWRYRPLREGSARIGSTIVNIENEFVTTDPIEVAVVPQSQRPQQQRRGLASGRSLFDRDREFDPADISDRDIFIRAIPSKRDIYQNEQVVVDYVLYMADGIQIRQSRAVGAWEADGFWREDLRLDDRQIPDQQIINGRRYNTIPIRRVAFFPTRSGELTIDVFRVQTEASISLRSGDPFDQFFRSFQSRFQPVTVIAPAVQLSVRPLPAGSGQNFSGAVGAFHIQANADRREVEAGNSVRLTVDITGNGNLAALDEPTILLPSLVEKYAPAITTDIDREGRRLRGTRSYTYVLVPRAPGDLEISPVTFDYFDPDAGQYRTATSDPIRLQVTGTAVALSTPEISGLASHEIAEIMTSPTTWITRPPTPIHRSPWLYGGMALPLVALALLGAYKRRMTALERNPQYARSRRAHPVARQHLKQAEALLKQGEARPFYREISRAVLGFIGNRLDVSEHGLTESELSMRLANGGVKPEIRASLRDLLDECDRALYAPIPPNQADMETATERAASLIAGISEQLHVGKKSEAA